MLKVNDAVSIKQQAIQSSKWALVARLSQVFGGAILLVILPFWLKPDDFGIITMFTSVLSLGMILQQAGFAEATIQDGENTDMVRDAAFWLNILISILLYFLLYLVAPVIGDFFNDVRIIVPLRVAGLQIVLAGISNIPMAWLQRTFRFKVFALIHLFGSLCMIGLALTLAIRGSGYWAYVVGILGGAVTRLVLSLACLDWIPRTRFDVKQWGRVLVFSSLVLLEMMLGWLLVWFDNVVVAKHLGSRAAGIYSLAFNIAVLTISLPCSGITGLTLSTFSRLQSDTDALRSAYLRATGLISAYAIPAGIGISLLGGWIVRLVYPQQWDSLGPILAILALYSGFGHLWILNTDAFKAIGKPEIMVKIYVPVVIVMLPIYWWSSHIGLFEFTLARSLVVLVGAIPHSIYAIRYLQLEKNYLWKLIRAPLFASMMMAIWVWLGGLIARQFLLPGRATGLMSITFIIAVGAAVYIATLWKLSPEFVRHAYGLFLRSTRQVVV